MAQYFKTVLASLLSASAVALAVIWLLKSSADVVLRSQLENVKHTLNVELEKYKAAIGTQEAENQFRFNKRLDFISQQLSEFYWPIYFRLQIDTEIYPNVVGDKADRLPDDIRIPMKQFLLNNHEETLKIIDSKFYLAEPNDVLARDLVKYVKHVAVLQAMKDKAGREDQVPDNVKVGFPPDLIADFKAQLDKLQTTYVEMMKEAEVPVKEPRRITNSQPPTSQTAP